MAAVNLTIKQNGKGLRLEATQVEAVLEESPSADGLAGTRTYVVMKSGATFCVAEDFATTKTTVGMQ